MAVFKCKMCGASLDVQPGMNVIECDYCGTNQTLPRLDDDRKANLYDRANHFRRNNEFDKAMSIYENILNQDTTDAEAYWSLVLCRYGIEYVEDPTTRKRIPTVNRAQYTSIYDDDNYKSAIKYADALQKKIYEEEANTINEIQKGILEISQKEEPFDVFICYKETDNNGRRTIDSVLANDLYHQLTQEGFKVFFARITLEDKLGTAYEPYIFAALNSSKVMVVLGTKPEYYNAVWVKNEWSRYLSLIKNGANKMLIPAYRDMDPYDLPEEFSHLQAQDMSKLGFMQDLIRGIKKILNTDTQPKVVVQEVTNQTNASIDPLLKRIDIFLEDKDWKSAKEYCEKVLDADPENAQAYLGKLMAGCECSVLDELKDIDEPFDNDPNYQKVLRYGDKDLVGKLKSFIQHINDRNEETRKENIYQIALEKSESTYKKEVLNALVEFKRIPDYKDTNERVNILPKAIKVCEYYDILRNGNRFLNSPKIGNALDFVDNETAITEFKKIIESEELKELLQELKDYDLEYDILEEANEKLKEATDFKNSIYYDLGIEFLKSNDVNDIEKAIKQFELIPDWKDSKEKIEECKYKLIAIPSDNIYLKGIRYLKSTLLKDVELAIKEFEKIPEWKDSKAKIQEAKDKIVEIQNDEIYNKATCYSNERKIDSLELAITEFTKIPNWKDSSEMKEKCIELLKELKQRKKHNKLIMMISIPIACIAIAIALVFVLVINPNNKYNTAMELMLQQKYDDAILILEELGNHKDAPDQLNEAMYLQAKIEIENGHKLKAGALLSQIPDYKDTEKLMDSVIKTGDIYSFGNYEQDGKKSNGKEPIKWRILKMEKDRVLMISEKILDCKPYHTSKVNITWSECSLRAWLNHDFMKEAFSDEEQARILKTNVINDDNPEYGTDGGEDTLDYIYLLSIEETNTYFTTDNARRALATKYAVNQGFLTNNDGYGYWWLRSSGYDSCNAANVFYDGYVFDNGINVDDDYLGVRPALWINLES